jgi:hypothetical protein
MLARVALIRPAALRQLQQPTSIANYRYLNCF